jgi:hypothetical protein
MIITEVRIKTTNLRITNLYERLIIAFVIRRFVKSSYFGVEQEVYSLMNVSC